MIMLGGKESFWLAVPIVEHFWVDLRARCQESTVFICGAVGLENVDSQSCDDSLSKLWIYDIVHFHEMTHILATLASLK